MSNKSVKSLRPALLGGLAKLEKVRHYLADCRLNKEFKKGEPTVPDAKKVENDLSDILILLYEPFKELYEDYELADGIDGRIPVWDETRTS